MNQERSKYSSSILTSKTPLDATEIVRVRLSQGKLINKNFSRLFKDISDLKKQYVYGLRNIIANNQDLSILLNQDMLEYKVLTSQELEMFKFDSLGILSVIWSDIIKDLTIDLQSQIDLYHILDKEVIESLKNFVEFDPHYTKTKLLHPNISQLALKLNDQKSDASELNEIQSKWCQDSPYLFESFEKADYNRLLNLKNCLLKFQNGLSDCLHNELDENEKSIDVLLNFNPELEIERFANESMNYDFKFQTKYMHESQATPPSKEKLRRSIHNLNFINNHTSESSVTKSQTFDKDSKSLDHSTLRNKKIPNKLKSKMDSIFNRNKIKNRKSQMKILESNDKDDALSLQSNTSHPRSIVESDSLYRISRNTKPVSPESSSKNLESELNLNSDNKSNMSINQLPLQPQRRSIHLNNASESDTDQSVSTSKKTIISSSSLMDSFVPSPEIVSRSAHNSINRRGTQTIRPVDLSHVNTSVQRPDLHLNSVTPQMTGELKQLNPQITGTSLSFPTATSQPLFHHTEMTSFGLNASIAEVINATFKDGILTSAQLIGEIALNYVPNGSELPLEINLNLSNRNCHQIEKIILNEIFIQKFEKNIFKINPQFIESKTLGAIKYSINSPLAPIIIHPVWKFEETQASVMLILKLAPKIPEEINELTLNDLTVFVSVDGAMTTNALSKPQGSFSKEKKRITWRFKDPTVLHRNKEERLIARFITDTKAHESSKGIVVKFNINNVLLGSEFELQSQEVDTNNPFNSVDDANWRPVSASRSLVAGNYHGLS